MKVRLTLDYYALRDGAVLRAARTAFGDGFVDRYRYSGHSVDLIATADQLVAFQVAREKLGAKNLWLSLNVEILDPTPQVRRVVVDVRPIHCR